MAERYKWMAYETLGLTPTSMGSPSQYATNEGIQVGQKAYFAQTFNIEHILMENKRANVEIHMSIAQHCQLNKKDANYIYMASNDELEFLQTIKDDEYFSLRQIDVRSTYNPKKNMLFQQLKQGLIQNNTMGSDALSLTELYLSDDFMELKDAARRARQYVEKMQTQQQESSERIAQSQQQTELKIHEDNMQIQREKIAGDIQESKINALGRASDKQSDIVGIDNIIKEGELALKQQVALQNDDNEKTKIQNDLILASKNFETRYRELDLKQQKINVEREKISAMRYLAERKNYDSTVNKN